MQKGQPAVFIVLSKLCFKATIRLFTPIASRVQKKNHIIIGVRSIQFKVTFSLTCFATLCSKNSATRCCQKHSTGLIGLVTPSTLNIWDSLVIRQTKTLKEHPQLNLHRDENTQHRSTIHRLRSSRDDPHSRGITTTQMERQKRTHTVFQSGKWHTFTGTQVKGPPRLV